jgi:hypothetical protein
MLAAGLKHIISAGERQQTHFLDLAATGTSISDINNNKTNRKWINLYN